MNDTELKYIQRVLESNAPDEDRERAAQMVRDMRRSQRTAPSDGEIIKIHDSVSSLPWPVTYRARQDRMKFARALLSRYGQAPAASTEPPVGDKGHPRFIAGYDAGMADARRMAASAEPVAWFVDWPDEPELGHYLAEAPADIDSGRSRALVFLDAAPVAAQAPERLLFRLRKHADDDRNSAFARSTMREALQYLERAQAPAAAGDALDAAFEAVRKELCKLPRYSFLLDPRGNVGRMQSKGGNWIEFDAAHKLFDPVAIDAAMQRTSTGSDK